MTAPKTEARAAIRAAIAWVLLDETHLSPKKLRAALRVAARLEATRTTYAPSTFRRVWRAEVRVALGSRQRDMRDRRQIELF